MPNVSSFGAQTDNSVVQGTVTDRAMVIPDIPPQGLMSVGPRVTPHFVKPSLWSALTTYHFFDAVHDAAGASYVAIKPEVPAGTELTDEDYWFLWADPNSQFADLSELVKTFNGRIAQNTADIATKAPYNHASEDTTYGAGNAANYGHVRLATEGTPLTSGANEGVAATPQFVVDTLNKKYKALWIGDSYTQANSLGSPMTRFSRQVSDALNMEEVNYGIGGTGFGLSNPPETGNNNFIDQLKKAANEITDKDDVKYVFVCGGRNDFSLNSTAPTGAIVGGWIGQILAIVEANFKNAQLIFIPLLYDCTVPVFNQISFYKLFMYVAKTAQNKSPKFKCIENAYTWLLGLYSAVFSKDKIHPNQKGHNIIARAILQSLYGSTDVCPATTANMPLNTTNLVSDYPNAVQISVLNNGLISANVNLKIANEIAFGSQLGHFTWTPSYEGADVLFIDRGTRVIPTNVGFIQLVATCNQATEPAHYECALQTLTTLKANTIVKANSIIGEYGVLNFKE